MWLQCHLIKCIKFKLSKSGPLPYAIRLDFVRICVVALLAMVESANSSMEPPAVLFLPNELWPSHHCYQLTYTIHLFNLLVHMQIYCTCTISSASFAFQSFSVMHFMRKFHLYMKIISARTLQTREHFIFG